MKIAIFVNTPAQAHFIRNIVKKLEENGHNIIIISRQYGDTLEVLKYFGLPNEIYSRQVKNKLLNLIKFPIDILQAYKIIHRARPNLIFGFGINETYTGLISRIPVIIFNDSEPKCNNFSYAIQFKLFMLFTKLLITPSSFNQDMGKKHLKVNSYKELAYLHPDYYRPNEEIFDLLQLKRNEDYALIRFNAFDAVHDIGITGISKEDKLNLVNELKRYVSVFISSEGDVQPELEKYIIKIPKSRIHDVLYYAKLFICDTQTMTTEAAILGTPVIRCNSFVGPKDMGNFIELEKKYSLMFNIRDPKKAIRKAEELIKYPNLKKEWRDKRERLLEDKCDITKFMVWFIENYPQSVKGSPNILGSNV